MVKIVKAILKLIETSLRGVGATGPNSRERVREKVVVGVNGREIKRSGAG